MQTHFLMNSYSLHPAAPHKTPTKQRKSSTFLQVLRAYPSFPGSLGVTEGSLGVSAPHFQQMCLQLSLDQSRKVPEKGLKVSIWKVPVKFILKGAK